MRKGAQKDVGGATVTYQQQAFSEFVNKYLQNFSEKYFQKTTNTLGLQMVHFLD